MVYTKLLLPVPIEQNDVVEYHYEKVDSIYP